MYIYAEFIDDFVARKRQFEIPRVFIIILLSKYIVIIIVIIKSFITIRYNVWTSKKLLALQICLSSNVIKQSFI